MCLRLATHSQLKHALFHMLVRIVKLIPDMELFDSPIPPVPIIKSSGK